MKLSTFGMCYSAGGGRKARFGQISEERFYQATSPELPKERCDPHFPAAPGRDTPLRPCKSSFVGKEQAVARCCGATVASAGVREKQTAGRNIIKHITLHPSMSNHSSRVLPSGRCCQESTTSSVPQQQDGTSVTFDAPRGDRHHCHPDTAQSQHTPSKQAR